MTQSKFACLLAVSLLGACGGDDTTPATDTSVADTPTADVADAGADSREADTRLDAADDAATDSAAEDTAEADVELDFTPDPACGGDWLVVVNGLVTDDSGTPVSGAKSQLCVHIGSPEGNLICLRPEDSGAGGEFSIVVPNSARCVGGGSMRIFEVDSTLATTYCHIETETEGGTLDIAEPIVLFETDAVEALPPYGDPDTARAIVFPGGFEVPEFIPGKMGFEFTESVYANLGARRVDPATEGLCFVEGEIDGLFAFRVEANVERAFDFRFPNDDGYDPGARVNLFVLGGLQTKLADGTQVAETAWENYGTATVSADGAWVEGSIPAFTWLGYALAE